MAEDPKNKADQLGGEIGKALSNQITTSITTAFGKLDFSIIGKQIGQGLVPELQKLVGHIDKAGTSANRLGSRVQSMGRDLTASYSAADASSQSFTDNLTAGLKAAKAEEKDLTLQRETGLKGIFLQKARELELQGKLTKGNLIDLKASQKKYNEQLRLNDLIEETTRLQQRAANDQYILDQEINALGNEKLKGLDGEFAVRAQILDMTGKLNDAKVEELRLEQQIYKQAENKRDLLVDINTAQQEYNNAIKQANADIQIKDIVRRLGLTEEETSQKARLLVEQNKMKGLAADLTAKQVEQLKNEDKVLKHKREQVEIVESLASWQLQLNEELEEYGKSWEKLKSKISAVVTDPKVLKTFLTVKGIETIKEKLEEGVEVFGEFRKEGLTMTQALGKTTSAIGAAFSLTGVGMKDAAEIQGAMLKEQGNMKNITVDTVQEVGKLAKTFGVSNEVAGKLVSQFQMMPGATAESATNTLEYAGALAKASGVAPGAIMESIASSAEDTAKYTKDGGKNIANAAVAAKKMGLELSTMAKMADSLLDFESSIAKQMEASVLLGREINLDKARELALNGDLAGATREVLANIGGEAEFNKMNVLQRKALAEAMGVSVQDLGKMVKNQDELNNLTQEQQEALANGASLTDVLAANAGGFLGKVKDAGLGLIGVLGSVSTLTSGLKSVGEILNMNILKGVTGMVRGMAGGVVQAGLFLAKLIAIGAIKLFGGSEQQLEKVKNFFGKEGVAGKFVDKVKGKTPELVGGADKAKDMVADKAGEVGDKASKASEKTKTIQPGKGLKDFFTNLAAGLKAMGDGKVLFGAFNLIAASPGLLIMSPVAFAAKLIEKVDGKKLEESLIGIANGVKAFGEGKVTAGAFNLIATSLGLTAMIPGVLGAKLIEKINGKAFSSSLAGVAQGLLSMSTTFVGSLALGAFAIAAILAIPSLIFLGGIALLGAPAAAGLIALGAGLSAFGLTAPATLIGIGLIALLGLAMIPFAAALAITTPAIEAFGNIIVGVLQQVPPIIKAIADGFVTMLGAISLDKILPLLILPPVLVGLGAGFMVFGAGALFAMPAIAGLTLALTLAGPALTKLAEIIGGVLIAAMQALPSIISAVAEGFNQIISTLADNWQILIPVGVGFGAIAIGLGALGAAALFATPGLLILNMLLPPIAAAMVTLVQAGNQVASLSSQLSTLVSFTTPLYALAAAMSSVSLGISTFAFSGLLAVPIIGSLIGLAAVSPMLVELANAFDSGGGESKETETAEPPAMEGKLDILISKIDELISVASKGGVINMDARKVGEIIRAGLNTSNIR